MKSLVESLNEQLVLNEGNSWSAGCPVYDEDMDNRDEIGNYADSLGDQLNSVKPAQVKKVFKVTGQDLDNYCAAVSALGDWWNGIASIAMDDSDEAGFVKGYFDGFAAGRNSVAYENTAENLNSGDYSNFSPEDGEDAYDILDNILEPKNWAKLIKAITGRDW